MTYFEARMQTVDDFIERFKLHEQEEQRKKLCTKIEKKICSRISCQYCIHYMRSCCTKGVHVLSDIQLDRLMTWADVKIKSKYILSKGENSYDENGSEKSN